MIRTGPRSLVVAGLVSLAIASVFTGRTARSGAALAKGNPPRVQHPLQVAPIPVGPGTQPTLNAPIGYTPAQIRAYLGLSGDGAGQTIAITNAFHAPTIREDVNTFSAAFGLPLACDPADAIVHVPDAGAECFTLTIAAPDGVPRSDSGWALEAALDVEWAHAIAPRATILLVEGAEDELDPMMRAIDYAYDQGASVISNSWYTEEFPGQDAYDRHCRLAHAVCVFASGDDGHPASYPATSPYAIGVGGTTLTLDHAGNVLAETAWRGSGGGVSDFVRRPRYQRGLHAEPMRGSPDVSYNADVRTGIPVYDSLGFLSLKGWIEVGGTSAGVPQWSAIIAVADQLRARRRVPPLAAVNLSAQRAIYVGASGEGALFDIVEGTNGTCGAYCAAAPGYDFVTGLGSPRRGIDIALAAAP